MNKALLILLLLAAISGLKVWAQAVPDVNALCRDFSIGTPSAPPDSHAAMRNYICGLARSYPGDRRLRQLERTVLGVLDRLPASGHWQEDMDLKNAMDDFGQRMNDLSRAVAMSSEGESSSELGTAINDLVSTYGTAASRRGLRTTAQKTAYMDAIQRVMGLTTKGREVLDCYRAATGGRLSGVERYVFEPRMGANFRVTETPEGSGRYDKVIAVNPDTEPLSLLRLMVHEMKHGCNARLHAENKDRFMTCNHNMDSFNALSDGAKASTPDPVSGLTGAERETRLRADLSVARDEYVHEAVVDEMRAYSADNDFSIEVMQARPRLYCQQFRHSYEAGGVLRHADAAALTRQSLQDGRFPRMLIRMYNRLGMYSNRDMFVLDSSGAPVLGSDGEPVLRPEVIARIRGAGYAVQ